MVNFKPDMGQKQATHSFSLVKHRLNFLWVYRRDKPTRDVGGTGEKLVTHEPETSNLQAFREQVNKYAFTEELCYSNYARKYA